MKFWMTRNRRRQAQRSSPWQMLLERLEERVLLTTAPTIAVPGIQTTLEDTSKAITGLSFGSAADPVTVTLSVSHGTLTLSQNVSSGLTATQVSTNGTSSVTIGSTVSATIAQVNNTLANSSGFTYTPGTDYNGNDTLTISVTDTTNSLTSSTTVPLSVTAVNDPPNFTVSPTNPPPVNEDAPLQVIPFATITNFGASNESTQTITKYTVTAGPTTGGLTFSTAPSIDPITGMLTYQPAANANGTATFSVTATDDGGTANSGNDTSAAHTFIITVNAVNDAPSFTLSGNPATVNEDASLQTVSTFATNVSAGATNESGQSLNFTLT